MRQITVFYAWQSDTDGITNRHLIRAALDNAAERINQDKMLSVEIKIDSDTQDVPGQPHITDTILGKILDCDIFVPDVTLVAQTPKGKSIPNANVMLEFGYALHAKTSAAFMGVMNTSYGDPDRLPFDMAHLRYPTTYKLDAGASDSKISAATAKLSRDLERTMRLQIGATMPPPLSPEPFVKTASKDGPARFRAPGVPLGVKWDFSPLGSTHGKEIFLSDAPAIWVRLIPSIRPKHNWPAETLKEVALSHNGSLLPLYWNSVHYLLAEDGFGMIQLDEPNSSKAQSIAFAFETGEIWAIDTNILGLHPAVLPFLENELTEYLERLAGFLRALEFAPPYNWEVGYTGTKGRSFYFPLAQGQPSFIGHRGYPCLAAIIQKDGTYSGTETMKTALMPFFQEVFRKCGLARPSHLDRSR